MRFASISLTAMMGCSALAGLESLDFRDPPVNVGGGSPTGQGGGAGGTRAGDGGAPNSTTTPDAPGGGGTGGMGSSGEALPNWAPGVDAHYTFDDGSALGNGTGPSLLPVNSPTAATGIAGAGSVSFDVGDGLQSAHPLFDLGPGDSFTILAWTRIESAPTDDTVELITRYESDGGFSMDFIEGTLSCWVGDGVEFQRARSPMASYPTGAWVHVGCRFDNENDLVNAFIDGGQRAMRTVDDLAIAPSAALRLNSTGFAMEGSMDDLVFHRGVLENEAIRRIYACAVDGSGCVCDPDEPTAYLDCGNIEPACDTLPPCNAPPP
ncbi:MAG: LamG-like jellyroll fold domain-containing protein [Myxococcota bacterium]